MNIIKQLLKSIYPSKCVLCKSFLEVTDDEYVCRLCHDKFEAEGKQLLKEDHMLHNIEGLSPRCVALFPYTSEYRSAILSWKYKGIRKYAKAFASLLIEEKRVFETVQVGALIPVPLAPSRLRKRGFNQALDLAVELGKLSDIPVWDCLERCKDTMPQAQCLRAQRYHNIKGSIQLKEKVIDNIEKTLETCPAINHMIIIDDIYTTGSTAKECIKVLKKAYIFRDVTFDIVIVGKGNF